MKDERYIKLFNQGYFLSEHDPDFLRKLLKATEEGSSEAHDPLSAGKSQYIQNKLKEKLKDISTPSQDSVDKGIEPNI